MRTRIPIYTDVGDDYGCVEYIQHMGSDQMVIDSARVSHASDESAWRSQQDPKLLRYLLRNEHWSPFESCTITWHVVVPLFVRSQWHRHKWSYNEVSRRYTSEDIRFYVPRHLRPQAESNKQASDWSKGINPDLTNPASGLLQSSFYVMQDWCKRAQLYYETLLSKGVAREQARMVLPQNTYTRFYATTNLRNALIFIRLREHAHAQWEIYKAAEAMREHLVHLFPQVMEAASEWVDKSGGNHAPISKH